MFIFKRRRFRNLLLVLTVASSVSTGGYHYFHKDAEASNDVTGIAGTVVRVIDGDTAVIAINGQSTTVRFIGVNTPETVKPNSPVECFGKQASIFTSTHLNGQNVRLETDPTQGTYDKYNRYLAYIWIGDTLFNKTLIEQGYGYEYTYNTSYKYQRDFKDAQRDAQRHQRGLWNPNTCPQH